MGRRNCTKSLKAHTKALVRIGIFQIRLANERKRVWIMRLFDTLLPTRRLYFTAISRELPKCPRLGSQHNQFLHDISHRLIPQRQRVVHLWTFILEVQPLPFRFSQTKIGRFSRRWWLWFWRRILWWERSWWFRSWWRIRQRHLLWHNTEQRCTIFSWGPENPIASWLSPDRCISHRPTLCKVYAIAVAILMSSATAECSSSAIKRVKTRIRSTMLQGRLEVYFCCCWAGNFTISGQRAHYWRVCKDVNGTIKRTFVN
jgi:hypothetical protein